MQQGVRKTILLSISFNLYHAHTIVYLLTAHCSLLKIASYCKLIHLLDNFFILTLIGYCNPVLCAVSLHY